MKALAIIFDGFEEEEAVAPFALLRRAGVELVIASDKETVIGSHKIALTNISLLKNINYKDFDCLIIPGGAHYKRLMIDEYVHKIIKYFMDNNKVVSAICAAPTIIGRLGYLKNRNYTCFTSMDDDFGGHYIDEKVVVDGNLITARSVASAIVFAYAIIKKLLGEKKLKAVFQQIYEK
jgi:putative intracellular protease/amidase